MLKRKLAAVLTLLLIGVSIAHAQMLTTGAGKKPVAAASYTGPGDIVASATAWGSCARAYSASFAATQGAICDVVDSATGLNSCTLNIGTNGFANLSSTVCTGTVSVTTFCTVTYAACKVSKIYDQTGNGHHMIQADNAARPAFTLSALNSLPCPTFSGSQNINDSGTITGTQPISFSTVAKRPSSGTFAGVVGLTYSNNVGILTSSSADTWWTYADGAPGAFTATDGSFHAVQAIINNASSAAYVDGSSTTGLTAGTGTTGQWTWGNNAAGNLNGLICEGGIWNNTTFSAGNQSSLNSNQHGSTNGYNF